MARYALVVGIAQYSGSFNSLPAPIKDANAIADLLDRHGNFDQVKRLPFRREAGQRDLGKVIQKPLTCLEFTSELQQFFQAANGSDVLFYYSGHGFTLTSPASGVREGFLAPSDCQVELKRVVDNGQVKVSPGKEIESQKNGISFYDLNALISQHSFSSLIMILDCCNSGALLESDMVRRDAREFGFQRDYYLITACRSASKAYEGEKYSLLTEAVLKGLSRENASARSGRVSGDRLFDVIGDELQNSRQEPLRMGWGRSITLVHYEQGSSTSEPASGFNPANPYMGLKAFEPSQADYFFGREAAVRALLDRLSENRFIAVIGPSGCGKSSLVKAGLLPQLTDDRIPGSSTWQTEIITPGQYPLQALTNILERHQSDDRSVILFVDQFEELFTLCPSEAEQRSFIGRLNEATTKPNSHTRVIIAMRGDFLDRCAKFQESADLINNTAPTTYMVTPLTETKLVRELRDAITCPADLHGVQFEDGLLFRIVEDVINQPGAMPLLQYALTQLWERCISANGSHLLTHEGYEAIDGVSGALQRWADQFYTNLSLTDQAFVKEMMGELVQLGDGGEVTRRRAPWERLRAIATAPEQLNRIIGQLVYQRLLVADDKTVEVAHEALLSESKLIQGWIEENRDSIRLQQRLEIYRREWEEHDRSENYLLDAGRLAAIEEWLEKKHPRLMPIDQEFIEKSKERRDRQFQAQLEQERRLREEAEGRAIAEIEKKIEAEARAEAESERTKEAEARAKVERRGRQIAVLAGVFAVFTLGLGFLAQLRQSQISEGQAKIAGTLVGKAQQLLETHNELEALISSVEALEKFKEMGRENQDELEKLHQVISGVSERNRIQAHQDTIIGIDSNPTQPLVVSGGADKKIRIWNLEKQSISPPVLGHQGIVRVLRFSPNGKIFASGSRDKTAKIWTVEGKPIQSFLHKDGIYDISFSNDGQLLAAAGDGNIISIWDVQTRKTVRTLVNKEAPNQDGYIIYGLDFHPQKKILIATGYKHEIAIWDLSQGLNAQPRRIGQSDSAATMSVRFSTDGTMIVSCNDKGIISIRDSNGNLIGKINTGENFSFYSEFSTDDKFIASISFSRAIKLWNVEKALELWKKGKKELTNSAKEFKTNTGSIYRISFIGGLSKSKDSAKLLASAGKDGIIGIWDIQQNKFSEERISSSNDLLVQGCKLLESYIKIHPKERKKSLTICMSVPIGL